MIGFEPQRFLVPLPLLLLPGGYGAHNPPFLWD
jgi:hypothetical protein